MSSLGFIILIFLLLRFNLDGLSLQKRYEIYQFTVILPVMLPISISYLALCIDQNRNMVNLLMIFLLRRILFRISQPYPNPSGLIRVMLHNFWLIMIACVIQFCMALSSNFEQLHIYFLHLDSFPKLEVVVVELLFFITTTDTIFAISSGTPLCQISYRHCHKDRHEISSFPKLQ